METQPGLGHARIWPLAAAPHWSGGDRLPTRLRGGLCALLEMPGLQSAQWQDQGRINFRKLNGKGKNAHVKKANLSSASCLWPVWMVILFNFPVLLYLW